MDVTERAKTGQDLCLCVSGTWSVPEATSEGREHQLATRSEIEGCLFPPVYRVPIDKAGKSQSLHSSQIFFKSNSNFYK